MNWDGKIVNAVRDTANVELGYFINLKVQTEQDELYQRAEVKFENYFVRVSYIDFGTSLEIAWIELNVRDMDWRWARIEVRKLISFIGEKAALDYVNGAEIELHGGDEFRTKGYVMIRDKKKFMEVRVIDHELTRIDITEIKE